MKVRELLDPDFIDEMKQNVGPNFLVEPLDDSTFNWTVIYQEILGELLTLDPENDALIQEQKSMLRLQDRIYMSVVESERY